MRPLWIALLPVGLAVGCGPLSAGETIPPAPEQFFNDYAGVCRPATVGELNARLEQFERDTSNQILVAVYPKMTSDSSIEDFTVRVAQSWKAGRKDKDNGAVLFVFIGDRKMYLQVGYGLEGVLPDARARQIIGNEIVPRFRQGDIDAGLQAGVEAILASVRGEYAGTGRTVAESGRSALDLVLGLLPTVFIITMVVMAFAKFRKAGRMITAQGGAYWYGHPGWMGGSGGDSRWSSGGSGGSGWSSGGGDSGGFSGGGGSFGGGGAGGSW